MEFAEGMRLNRTAASSGSGHRPILSWSSSTALDFLTGSRNATEARSPAPTCLLWLLKRPQPVRVAGFPPCWWQHLVCRRELASRQADYRHCDFSAPHERIGELALIRLAWSVLVEFAEDIGAPDSGYLRIETATPGWLAAPADPPCGDDGRPRHDAGGHAAVVADWRGSARSSVANHPAGDRAGHYRGRAGSQPDRGSPRARRRSVARIQRGVSGLCRGPACQGGPRHRAAAGRAEDLAGSPGAGRSPDRRSELPTGVDRVEADQNPWAAIQAAHASTQT